MAIITRREAERDKALRQAQSKLAEEMKRLQAAAETKPAELNKKEITNANENQQAQ